MMVLEVISMEETLSTPMYVVGAAREESPTLVMHVEAS